MKTWLAAGLAAVVFGIGGFFGIQAVTHHSHATTTATGLGGNGFPGGGPGFGGGGPGFPGSGTATFGTIKSISGSTLTLSAPDGSTIAVTTSPSTTVTKAAAGSVSDIREGDHVVVRGTSSSGGITALGITDSGAATAPAARGGAPGGDTSSSGTVASIVDGRFTLSESGGTTVMVDTSSSTAVTVIQPSAVLVLAVGDSIRVTGPASNGTVAATSIESGVAGLGPGGGPGGGPGAGPGGGFGGALPAT